MQQLSENYIREKRRLQWKIFYHTFLTLCLAFWMYLSAIIILDWALFNILPSTYQFFAWIPLTAYVSYLFIKLFIKR
jgi:hypothetical protein